VKKEITFADAVIAATYLIIRVLFFLSVPAGVLQVLQLL